MLRRSLPTFLPLMMLCLTAAAAMLLSVANTTISHSPVAMLAAEFERHAELAAEVADHGHSHDTGDENERDAGHMHGHNPADHNHDPPLATAALRIDRGIVTATWTGFVPAALDGRRGPRLDRPPDLA